MLLLSPDFVTGKEFSRLLQLRALNLLNFSDQLAEHIIRELTLSTVLNDAMMLLRLIFPVLQFVGCLGQH